MREWIGPRGAASACGGEFASTLPPASQKSSGPLCHGAQSVSDMNAVLLAGTRQTREGAGRTSGVGHPDIISILRRGPDLWDARAPWSRRHSAHNERPWEPPQRGHPNPGTAHRQRSSPLPRPPLPPRPLSNRAPGPLSRLARALQETCQHAGRRSTTATRPTGARPLRATFTALASKVTVTLAAVRMVRSKMLLTTVARGRAFTGIPEAGDARSK